LIPSFLSGYLAPVAKDQEEISAALAKPVESLEAWHSTGRWWDMIYQGSKLWGKAMVNNFLIRHVASFALLSC